MLSIFFEQDGSLFFDNRVEHQKFYHSAAGPRTGCVFGVRIGYREIQILSSNRSHYPYYAIILVKSRKKSANVPEPAPYDTNILRFD